MLGGTSSLGNGNQRWWTKVWRDKRNILNIKPDTYMQDGCEGIGKLYESKLFRNVVGFS